MGEIVKIKIDLSWLEDIYAKDKSDVDKLIDAHAKIYKILGNDFEIAQLIRELKRSVHHKLMSTNITEYKNIQSMYETMLYTANRINALKYFTVYCDDPEFVEVRSLVYEHSLEFTSMLNKMPDSDLRAKLWPLMVYPPSGCADVQAIADELILYMNTAYDIQQDNIYESLYALRFEGLKYEYVEEILDNLSMISYKVMLVTAMANKALAISEDINKKREAAEAEKAAKKATKKTTRKKDDKKGLESDPELS